MMELVLYLRLLCMLLYAMGIKVIVDDNFVFADSLIKAHHADAHCCYRYEMATSSG